MVVGAGGEDGKTQQARSQGGGAGGGQEPEPASRGGPGRGVRHLAVLGPAGSGPGQIRDGPPCAPGGRGGGSGGCGVRVLPSELVCGRRRPGPGGPARAAASPAGTTPTTASWWDATSSSARSRSPAVPAGTRWGWGW